MSALPVNMNSQLQVSSVLGTGSLEGKSIQYLFAMAQLELSRNNKSKATEKINQIRDSQENQRRYSEAINSMRSLKSEIEDSSKDSQYYLEKSGKLEEYKAIQSEYQSVKEAVTQSKSVTDGIESNVKSLTSQIDALTRQLETAKNEFSQFQSLKDIGKFAPTVWNSRNEALKSNISMFERQISSLTKTKEQLEIQLNASKSESSDLSAKLSKLQVSKEQMDSLLSNAKTDYIKNEVSKFKNLQLNDGTSILDSAKVSITDKPSASDIDSYIASLNSVMETYGMDTQQLMIECQDYMGQYNTYLSGANSQIQKESEVNSELARCR
ncbi:MAG: hypothetical protein ACI4NE_04160 [Succinivibrio sp.]